MSSFSLPVPAPAHSLSATSLIRLTRTKKQCQHLPGASYNLTTDKKRAVCQWLRAVKVPTGFSSNIKSLVSMKDFTLTSFNAHDCHIMLMMFLPIVIRAIGPEYVKMVITGLGYFFNWITQKVIDEADLPGMKQFIAETIYQLEMCFPPSYFDIKCPIANTHRLYKCIKCPIYPQIPTAMRVFGSETKWDGLAPFLFFKMAPTPIGIFKD